MRQEWPDRIDRATGRYGWRANTERGALPPLGEAELNRLPEERRGRRPRRHRSRSQASTRTATRRTPFGPPGAPGFSSRAPPRGGRQRHVGGRADRRNLGRPGQTARDDGIGRNRCGRSRDAPGLACGLFLGADRSTNLLGGTLGLLGPGLCARGARERRRAGVRSGFTSRGTPARVGPVAAELRCGVEQEHDPHETNQCGDYSHGRTPAPRGA